MSSLSHLRSRTALWVGATAALASRLLRRGAGEVIGSKLALAFDPDLLRHVGADRRVIVVSGTNGKSTTTALVQAALGNPVDKQTGANMPTGWVTTLIRTHGAVALEVDEPYLAEAMEKLSPEVVCLLNLSRDQLDRTSEVRQIAEKWRLVIAGTTTQIVANANDPLIVYAVGPALNVTWVDAPLVWVKDASSCPLCTRPLSVEGDWECACGFRRPTPTWHLNSRSIEGPGVSIPFSVALPGEYNRGNAAMAIVSAHLAGIQAGVAASRVSEVKEVLGRFGTVRWRGRRWHLFLAKNPAGLAALAQLTEGFSSDLVISINDNVADGRDPSWLYDAPFDEIARGHRVFCTGSRALDIATRLHYSGIESTVITTLDDLPEQVTASVPVTVIANYTAFSEWQRRGTPC